MVYDAIVLLFVYLYSSILLWWRRFCRKTRFNPLNVVDNTRPNQLEEDLDSQKLTENSTGDYEFDEIWFAFANRENYRIYGQILSTLDPLNSRLISRLGCLSIQTESGNTFTLPTYPEMSQQALEVKNGTDSEENTLKSFGLSYKVNFALHKIHIQFNGMMKSTTTDLAHVKFSLVFTEISRPFVSSCDSSAWLYAHGVIKHGKTKFNQMWNSMESFDQWGQAVGTLYIEDSSPKQLIMKGVRSHSFGKIPFNFGLNTVAISDVHVYLNDGNLLSIRQDSRLPKPVGYCIQPYIHFENLVAFNPDSLEISEDRFICASHSLELRGLSHVQWTTNKNDLPQIEIRFSKVFRNGEEVGWAVSRNILVPMKLRPVKLVESNQLTVQNKITPDQSNIKCCNILTFSALCAPLVGGKAIQLAVMSQSHVKEFAVPKAVVLTTKAYQSFLHENEKLKSALERINEASSRGVKSEIRNQCDQAASQMESAVLSSGLKAILCDELMRYFGSEWTSLSYAVRSSSVGEDGTTLSSAGQMQSILNVNGVDHVCAAVVKCWASGCSFPVVDYRRTHGQLPLAPMAVVIQEMVHPDAAGVMFTCDPVSGNPSKLVITAVKGLGESVVDGTVTPDTIIVRRNSHEITEMLPNNNHQCCLSPKLSLQLAAIGLQVEKIFGTVRDIEWALRDNKFYLLQARPITTLDVESEFELIHEFDFGYLTDFEYTTRANVGEVAPEPQTPLSTCIGPCAMSQNAHVMFLLMRGGKWTNGMFGFWRRPAGLLARSGFPMIQNYVQLDLLTLYSHIGATHRHVIDLCLLGHPYDDDFIDKVVEERTDTSWIHAFWRRLETIQALKPILSQSYLRGIERRSYQLAQLELDCSQAKTSAQLFRLVLDYLPTLFSTACLHGDVSGGAMIYYSVMMSLITKSSEDWTSENYCDVATLLSSCTEVVSAEVPNQIRDLAKSIADSSMGEIFIGFTPEDAVDWLNSSESGQAGIKFADFLSQNGHRAINEMEVRVSGWAADPKSLISLLQNLIKEPRSLEYSKVTSTVEEAVGNLKVELSRAKKWILTKLLPRARYSVGLREKTKSNVVKCVDRLKLGLRALAKQLVEEQRIPDEDLLFFFTVAELQELTIGNQPLIVSRANKRRRIYPQLKEFQFPEVSMGFPLPVQVANDQSHSVFELAGTPVCKGVVKGTARVIMTVADAHNIKHGDILITNFTDIGWTPYFALLSGVVTELGGILSHGAVVAREYGLPCLVNVKTATTVFKSGDLVILDAFKGVLKKLD